MIHYFGVFVTFLFPLAAFLLFLLIGPMPDMLRRPAQKLVDVIMYSAVQIGPINLSVFNLVMIVAGLTAYGATAFMCTIFKCCNVFVFLGCSVSDGIQRQARGVQSRPRGRHRHHTPANGEVESRTKPLDLLFCAHAVLVRCLRCLARWIVGRIPRHSTFTCRFALMLLQDHLPGASFVADTDCYSRWWLWCAPGQACCNNTCFQGRVEKRRLTRLACCASAFMTPTMNAA